MSASIGWGGGTQMGDFQIERNQIAGNFMQKLERKNENNKSLSSCLTLKMLIQGAYRPTMEKQNQKIKRLLYKSALSLFVGSLRGPFLFLSNTLWGQQNFCFHPRISKPRYACFFPLSLVFNLSLKLLKKYDTTYWLAGGGGSIAPHLVIHL